MAQSEVQGISKPSLGFRSRAFSKRLDGAKINEG